MSNYYGTNIVGSKWISTYGKSYSKCFQNWKSTTYSMLFQEICNCIGIIETETKLDSEIITKYNLVELNEEQGNLVESFLKRDREKIIPIPKGQLERWFDLLGVDGSNTKSMVRNDISKLLDEEKCKILEKENAPLEIDGMLYSFEGAIERNKQLEKENQKLKKAIEFLKQFDFSIYKGWGSWFIKPQKEYLEIEEEQAKSLMGVLDIGD